MAGLARCGLWEMRALPQSKKRRRRGKAAEMERLLEGICMLGRRARKDTFEASGDSRKRRDGA